ncbi:MAG TPA: recombination regulator RecX [Burkholderiales bacterium]|nr:recombination regulator RecX [Burkholderiales bacterium]
MREQPDLKTRALRYLARHEHSRLELERKLAPHTDDAAELETVLDEMERRGWLSAQRVVEQTLHNRRTRYGSRRIVRELEDKGIAEALITEAARQLRAGEVDAAREVWRRKFGTLPGDARERARQMRFLLGRGFDPEAVNKVVNEKNDD